MGRCRAKKKSVKKDDENVEHLMFQSGGEVKLWLWVAQCVGWILGAHSQRSNVQCITSFLFVLRRPDHYTALSM